MSKVKIANVRLSFPSIWKMAEYNGQTLNKYEATFLIAKDDPQAKVIQDAVKAAGLETLGKEWAKAKLCIIDGDSKDYDGYADHWALKASTKKRPLLIDRDKSVLAEEDDVLYAGCYVNASISIYAFSNNYGKFVMAQLNGIQFSKAGDSFGGDGGNAMDDFDDEGEAASPSAFDEPAPF